MGRRGVVFPIFFLSGASGLIYQVVWVRQFGNIFGNTVYSAALVTTLFMAGLGIGGHLAGAWADRKYAGDPAAPLRWYGVAEILIALLAGAIAIILPLLEPLSASFSSYVPTQAGWFELSLGTTLARYSVAALLLLPVTVLMGSTLTLLIRFIVANELSEAGPRVGLLYGINTAGAAIGCLSVDLALIPALGLAATQGVGVMFNLIAGVLALRLSRSKSIVGSGESDVVPSRADDRTSDEPDRRFVVPIVASALLLSGFVGMGLEITWFRFLISLLGGTRAVFSVLLTTILLGIWLGSTVGGIASRWTGKPVALFLLVQALIVPLAMPLLFSAGEQDVIAYGHLSASSVAEVFGRRATEWLHGFGVALRVVGAPAFLMGFTFPLANHAIQLVPARVGRRAGFLYLANTTGAVLGSLVAGFVFIPWLGMQSTMAAMACVSLLAVLLLATLVGSRLLGVAATLVGSIALVLWLRLPEETLLRASFRAGPEVPFISMSEGPGESIAVFEGPDEASTQAMQVLDPTFKGPALARSLYTNGHKMSGTSFAGMRYMRAFVHIPLLLMDDPHRVLVICFGVGNTAHSATAHPSVEDIQQVDLSKHVLRQAKYFKATNGDVLNNDKVSVFVNDGRQHLRMATDRFDLITLEPPPPGYAGISALYSVDFYRLARRRLSEHGYISQWLPAYQLPAEHVLSAVKAFTEVFPRSVLLSGDRRELILLGSANDDEPLTIDPQRVAERLSARPQVQLELTRLFMGTMTELVGTFVASSEALQKAVQDVVPVSDDFPILEYSGVKFLTATRFPRELIAVQDYGKWCPKCVDGGEAASLVPDLALYLRVLESYYLSDEFLNFGAQADKGTEFHFPSGPEFDGLWARQSYLRAIFKR